MWEDQEGRILEEEDLDLLLRGRCADLFDLVLGYLLMELKEQAKYLHVFVHRLMSLMVLLNYYVLWCFVSSLILRAPSRD